MKETQFFLKHFKGHTTFVGATKTDIFTNYTKAGLDELKQLNDLGHSIYFTVNETSPAGRKMENLESIRAIFADDDTLREEPYKFPLEPSIIVQSSQHNGKAKHQYYWLTSTEDYKAWEMVMEGIIQVHKMDSGAKDLARILRVPGFLNHKYDPPTPCKLLECTGTVYEWDEILKKFPPLEAKYREPIAKIVGGDDFNEHAHFHAFLTAESISPSMNALIAHWGHHYSATNIRKKIDQLFEQVPLELLGENKVRYYAARAQVDKFIKSIKQKVAKERKASDKDQAPVTPIRTIIPDSLIWDWSLLQSNPIPEDAIPAAMLEAAKEVGDWSGVGQDPAILSAVFITSAILSKNVLIHEIDSDLETHCQSGICIVMDTGARKSAIYNQMNKPFFEYEDRLREEWAEEKHIQGSKHKTLTSKVNSIRKKFDSKPQFTDNEFNAHIRETAELDKQIDDIQLKEPWLRSSDITEEKLVRKLDENHGVMAIISDDARQVINNIKGKYSKSSSDGGTGESVYINGLTGSEISYSRVGSDHEILIKKPVINALLFVQPDAALALKNSDMFVPSGLAARLPMYFYPVSGVDIVKKTTRRKIDSSKMQPYYSRLAGLCLKRIDNPLHIRLSDNAMEACKLLDKRFVRLLETKWRGQYDKSNKTITLSLMYASCFAALDDPEFSIVFNKTKAANSSYSLGVKYINAGFKFAEALFSQSIISHNSIHYESLPRRAESFLNTVQKWYSSGKMYEGFVPCGALQNQLSTVVREDLTDIVDFLVEKRWLLKAKMTDEKRKLNGGFPDKLVDTGDVVFHLNIKGIKLREEMGLNSMEEAVLDANSGIKQ